MSERLSRKWNAEFQVTYLYSYLQPDTSYFNQHLRIWNSLSSELTRAEFINRGEFAARLIICCFVRWNARGRKHACCARKNNAKLLLDMENSVKRKRVYGIDSHCNGRIKVSTLRYLGTFHPAVRIRLIYLFIFFFLLLVLPSTPFSPPYTSPLLVCRCWLLVGGEYFVWTARARENKSKAGVKFANVCRKTFRRIGSSRVGRKCLRGRKYRRGRGIIKSNAPRALRSRYDPLDREIYDDD